LGCEKCNGDFVVGEGGRLECSRCGNIVGDISLLFKDKPFDNAGQYGQSPSNTTEGYVVRLHPEV
jgi:hypothetical protein